MRKLVIMLLVSNAYMVKITTSMRQINLTGVVSSQARCELMAALWAGYFQIAEEIITNKPEVLVEYKNVACSSKNILSTRNLFMTPFHQLVAEDNLCALEFLLQQPKSVDMQVIKQVTQENKYSPLYFVRSKAALKLLFKHGADIHAKDSQQRTLVELALFDSKIEPIWILAHFLLKKNRCDINAPIDKHGDTLLHKAVQEENIGIVRFLLSRGANPESGNDRALSPFRLAKLSQNEDVISLFNNISHNSVSVPTVAKDSGNTSLHNAVIKKDCKNTECLMGNDPNVDLTVKNNDGLTAFDLVMQCKDERYIEFFKKVFARVFIWTDSYTPQYKNHKIFLINYFGINTFLDEGNATLLHMAISAKRYDKCCMLLKKRANPNAMLTKTMSPLFMALTNKEYSIALLLLDFGAIVEEKLMHWNLPDSVNVKMKEKYKQQNSELLK